MTVIGGAAKGLKRMVRGLAERPLAQSAVRKMVAYSWSRRLLNAAYLRLTPDHKRLFHDDFSRIFRTTDVRGVTGSWEVSFLNKRILMPLTDRRLWLDWDTAVSIVAHDLEVKETYEALIDSADRPELFVDIGANYGTHSLLFLVHRIQTLTFEPNSSCHEYFRSVCALNGVEPTLEPVALGDTAGEVDLSYPDRDTWSGSTDPGVLQALSAIQKLTTERVALRRLDDYLERIGPLRTLIKIDTEGNELNVLRGAAAVIERVRPTILFESWRHSDRAQLFSVFGSHRYRVHSLPWSVRRPGDLLACEPFTSSRQTNFIAVPEETGPR